MKKQFIIKTNILIALLLIVSCGPFSKYPLSNPSHKHFDERLSGLWILDSTDEVYLHFGKGKDNRTQIIFVEHNDNLSLDFGLFTMYPTIIEKNCFGNFQFLDETGNISTKNNEFMFFKYSINKENNKLSIAFLGSDIVEKSIKDGELVGVISDKTRSEKNFKTKSNYNISIPKITDSSQNIINFIKSKDLEKLFPKIMTFKRLTNKE